MDLTDGYSQEKPANKNRKFLQMFVFIEIEKKRKKKGFPHGEALEFLSSIELNEEQAKSFHQYNYYHFLFEIFLYIRQKRTCPEQQDKR